MARPNRRLTITDPATGKKVTLNAIPRWVTVTAKVIGWTVLSVLFFAYWVACWFVWRWVTS